MKLKTIVFSMAVIAMIFISCEDTKKKEAEEQAKAEELRMEREKDSLIKVEEIYQAKMAEIEASSIAARTTGNADLSSFSSVLQGSDMSQTLRTEGDYTVFAPSNDAFNKVQKSTMENWTNPENKEQLQKVLQYHVLEGKMTAADVLAKIKEANNKMEVTTLNGDVLSLTEKNGNITVTDSKGVTATVTSADMDASNGVVHIIDKVLMPKM